MKKVIQILCFLLAAIFCDLSSHAQSATDIRIANAMNKADWFELYDIYNSTPKDSINGFLEVFSRCLLGNRFNRPDLSLPAFKELMESQSANLDLSNLLSSSILYAMDLSRVGKNDAAAKLLNSTIDVTKQYIDSAAMVSLEQNAKKYAELSAYDTYGLNFNGNDIASIPFKIIPVGPAEKQSVLMHLENCSINGTQSEITFDTGAGVNIISDSLAQVLNLIPLDAGETVAGVGKQSAHYAIAKELILGNLTLTNVPFCVLNLTSFNEEADKYIDAFNIIIGLETMLQLKDLTLDFSNKQIMIPAIAPAYSNVRPNLCLSPELNIQTQCSILGEPMLLTIDSGDAQFGSLGSKFFERNKDYVLSHGTEDKLRRAGIAGVYETKCYKLPDVPLSLGGANATIPAIDVIMADGDSTQDERLGLKTLMLFDKVRFNFVDFTVTALPSGNKSSVVLQHNNVRAFDSHQFDYKHQYEWKQGVGMLLMGITRAVLFPTAPDIR